MNDDPRPSDHPPSDDPQGEEPGLADNQDSERDPRDAFASIGAQELPTVADPLANIEGPGAWIGRYKLLHLIGEGGMGEVWMAEQREPVEQRVALKIVKAGMDTRQVVARFEAERQALAMMNHPNIARIFDGGASELGRPYFVMELVAGTPITDYCNQNKLSTRERLEIFQQVCAAIAHAHQKGVIHRDIKPSNILVTNLDGAPLPKVIDFGIAKATGKRLTESTYYTELGQVIGTLAYMAPEQAQLSAEDVDTRSDVYSLGLLLYELLTGSAPFGEPELRPAAMDEMLRVIREVDPPKPSTKLSSMGPKALTVAAQHRTDPKRLGREVCGELDWIVMRSLEKDRNRRYQSVGNLGDDVGRYLRNDAVEASPPSRSYRLRKLIRRHKVEFGAAAAVTVILILSAIFSVGMALRERNQRIAKEDQRKRAVESLIVARQSVREMLLVVGDSELRDVPEMDRVREMLIARALEMNQKLLAIDDQDSDLRSERARTHAALGSMYEVLGDTEKAVAEHELAVRIFRELVDESVAVTGKLAEDDAAYYVDDLARALRALGLACLEHQPRINDAEGFFSESVKHFEEAIKNARHPRKWPFERAKAVASLGMALKLGGQSSEGECVIREAIDAIGKIAPLADLEDDEQRDLGGIYSSHARSLTALGKDKEAIQANIEAYKIASELVKRHPKNRTYREAAARTALNAGIGYNHTEDIDEGIHYTGEALKHYEILSQNHPYAFNYKEGIGSININLSALYRKDGDYELAEVACKDAVKAFEELNTILPKVTKYKKGLASALNNYGGTLMEGKGPAEFPAARRQFERAIRLQEEVARESRDLKIIQQLGNAHFNLGWTWTIEIIYPKPRADWENATAAFEKAEGCFSELVEAAPKEIIHQADLGSTRVMLARALTAAGDVDGARIKLEAARAILEPLARTYPDNLDHEAYLAGLDMAESFLVRAEGGEITEADTLLVRAIKKMTNVLGRQSSFPGLAGERAAARWERLRIWESAEQIHSYPDAADLAIELGTDPAATHEHLQTAAKTLQRCIVLMRAAAAEPGIKQEQGKLFHSNLIKFLKDSLEKSPEITGLPGMRSKEEIEREIKRIESESGASTKPD